MKAFILAAGFGTRLGQLTKHMPKPMLPVHGRPLLAIIIEKLRQANVQNIIINLHHLGDVIENYFQDGAEFGVNIHYSYEPTLLDTGGGIYQALPLLGDEPFMVINGDIYSDYDFNHLYGKLQADQLAHCVCIPKPDYATSGFAIDEKGMIVLNCPTAYYHSGIAVMSPKIFTLKPDLVKQRIFSYRDLLFSAIDLYKVSGSIHYGSWFDIGIASVYQALKCTANEE